MESEALINAIAAVSALLFLAAVLAFVLKRLRFPYTVGLVLLGVVLALTAESIPGIGEAIEAFDLEPDVIIFVFIPALIFESAINIDVRQLVRNLAPTLLLTIVGLLLTAAIVGFGLSAVTSIPLAPALVFGILISATDPVAVIALFKEVGAPKRLTVLMEGESLFNDATAIVTTQIALVVVVTGILDRQVIFNGVTSFLVVFLGGLIVGLGFGYILTLAIRIIGDEPLVQITLTMVVAYGSFIVAEHFLNTSGIMAVLGSGLVIGYEGQLLYGRDVRRHLEVFWEHLAFMANSCIFLLLGLAEVTFLTSLAANWRRLLLPVVAAVVLVTLSRAVAVFGLMPLVNRVPRVRSVGNRYQTVMWWGGVRGAVAVAIALSLPRTFPFRWQIIDLTFSVVLFTLLVNGATMRRLLGKLGLDRPSPVAEMMRTFVRTRGTRAALDRLDRSRPGDVASPAAATRVRRELAGRLAGDEKRLAELRDEIGSTESGSRHLLWLRALTLQRQVYRQRFRDGLLSLRSVRELEWDLQDREQAVLAGGKLSDVELPQRMKAEAWIGSLQALRLAPDVLRQNSAGRIHREVSALFAAARVVLAEVDQCRSFSGASPGDVAALVGYYEELKQLAARQMSVAEDRVTELGHELQERQLWRLAGDAEQAAVNGDSEDSAGLPARLAANLETNGSRPQPEHVG